MNQRGRPPSFDKAVVLTRAMDVFWDKGYEGTSIQDLTEATGLSRASLYNCFTDKEHLFLAVIDHYIETESSRMLERLVDETRPGAAAIRAYFEGLMDFSGRRGRRLGCLLTNTATHIGDQDASLEDVLDRLFARLEGGLRTTLERGLADGSVRPSVEPKETARLLVCLAQGLRVLSRRSLRDETFLSDAVNAALNNIDAVPDSAVIKA